MAGGVGQEPCGQREYRPQPGHCKLGILPVGWSGNPFPACCHCRAAHTLLGPIDRRDAASRLPLPLQTVSDFWRCRSALASRLAA
jgi:hypothetical protein